MQGEAPAAQDVQMDPESEGLTKDGSICIVASTATTSTASMVCRRPAPGCLDPQVASVAASSTAADEQHPHKDAYICGALCRQQAASRSLRDRMKTMTAS